MDQISRYWYRDTSMTNNWYKNCSDFSVPRCVGCDSYIIENDTDNNICLCNECMKYIQARSSRDLDLTLASFNQGKLFYRLDHIPEFSVITASYKNNDFLTTGIDWREVLVTDMVEEDIEDSIFEGHKETEKRHIKLQLLSLLINIGNLMYADMFDEYALRSEDKDVNSLIKDCVDTLKKDENLVVAWKSINPQILEQWLKNGVLPKGEYFSLPKYFYVEKNKSISEDLPLFRVFVNKEDVNIKRNNSIRIKKDVSLEAIRFDIM